MEQTTIAFDKHMSCMLRGLAVALMVFNHSMPGVLIPFAVPLFSFMVGYGYTFAKQRNLSHGVKRIKHLLYNFWFILFVICLPLALYIAPQLLTVGKVLLCTIGLRGDLNWFCWYIYFYAFAMLTLPWLSRVIDRYGLKGTIGLCAGFGLLFWGLWSIPGYDKIMGINQLARCAKFMPVVLSGYWVGSVQLYSKIKVLKEWWVAIIAALLCCGLYMLRGIDYAMIFDILWVPIFAGLFSVAMGFGKAWLLKPILTHLGRESMNIWFLHALFFTHLTRKPFLPLISWIENRWLMAIAVLILSYLMSCAVSVAYNWVTKQTQHLSQRALSRG